MRQSKILVTLAVLVWYALLSVMFVVVRPELAYSYGHWLHDSMDALPHLTAFFSLPVLGPSISTPTESYSPIFWLVWGALFLLPSLLLRRAWTTRERLDLLEFTLYWGALYGIGMAILSIFVALGLWLPFSAA